MEDFTGSGAPNAIPSPDPSTLKSTLTSGPLMRLFVFLLLCFSCFCVLAYSHDQDLNVSGLPTPQEIEFTAFNVGTRGTGLPCRSSRTSVSSQPLCFGSEHRILPSARIQCACEVIDRGVHGKRCRRSKNRKVQPRNRLRLQGREGMQDR